MEIGHWCTPNAKSIRFKKINALIDWCTCLCLADQRGVSAFCRSILPAWQRSRVLSVGNQGPLDHERTHCCQAKDNRCQVGRCNSANLTWTNDSLRQQAHYQSTSECVSIRPATEAISKWLVHLVQFVGRSVAAVVFPFCHNLRLKSRRALA